MPGRHAWCASHLPSPSPSCHPAMPNGASHLARACNDTCASLAVGVLHAVVALGARCMTELTLNRTLMPACPLLMRGRHTYNASNMTANYLGAHATYVSIPCLGFEMTRAGQRQHVQTALRKVGDCRLQTGHGVSSLILTDATYQCSTGGLPCGRCITNVGTRCGVGTG